MNHVNLRLVAGSSAIIASALLSLAAAHAQSSAAAKPAAQAHRLGQHPAVLVQAQAHGIDPNRFIVQPPASVTWRVAPEADLRWAAPVAPTPEDAIGKTPPHPADTSVAQRGS